MYCKLVIDGKVVYIKKAAPTGDEVEITEMEFLELAAEFKHHAKELDRYTTLVLSGELEIENVPEEYVDEIMEIQMQILITAFAESIISGETTIEDVPEEYRAAVTDTIEFIINIPESNPYGIPSELLTQIKDDTVAEIEEAVVNGID